MRRAIVVGRAAGAMDEYLAARAMCTFDDIIVVGKMGEIFSDRIDYWVSFHLDLFDKWAATRAAAGHPPATCICGAYYKGRRLGVVHKHGRDIIATSQRPILHVPCTGGSSGFMAAKSLALDTLCCDRVVLVGVPMTAEGHHYVGCMTPQEHKEGRWGEADKYWKVWEEHLDGLRERVRSMSGRTAEVFGVPTVEWLGG